MCLIVDANVANLVFAQTPSEDFRPVWEAILKGRAKAVHGGRLTEEYKAVRSIVSLLVELGRQGKLIKVPDDAVEAETQRFEAIEIKSDDPHILALAQISKVRLLCSHDRDLHVDFTNSRLLHPAGSVYQNAGHVALIRKHCKGGAGRKKRTRRR